MKPAQLASRNISGKILLLLGVFFAVIIAAVFVIGSVMADRSRQALLQKQQQDFAPPETAIKRQVKKVTLKRQTEAGEETIEILANGQINIFDQNQTLKKQGLLGFAKVNNLFEKINLGLDNFETGYFGPGQYTLIIETNHGTTTVTIGGGTNPTGSTLPGDIGDIIDDIDDIANETLYPSPTPTHAPQPSGIPTLTPSPYPPGYTPRPTPTFGPSPTPGGPTPLPAYMTAPPFTCEQLPQVGKPIPVSNIICGADNP